MKILIAEDDNNMSKIMKLYFEREGYEVYIVDNGRDALDYIEKENVDLIILDWMMPYMDGIEVCKEIKKTKYPTKIIMVTAKDKSSNELKGLIVGADDYIKKPFDMNILLVRIKKLCSLEEIHYKDLKLIPSTCEVIKDNKKIELTKKEFDIIKYLLENRGIIMSRERILDNVWGLNYFGDDRTVDTHISRIRRKLGGNYIKTKVGIGYIIED